MQKYRLQDNYPGGQTFDPAKNIINKKGQLINLYDFIQENREDTELYPTLEKYGCIDKIIVDKKAIYANFQELMGMREMHEQERKANALWESLPIDIRKEFNNDRLSFMQHGEEWLKGKIKAEQKAAEANKLTNKTTVNEVKANEQKQ